MQKPRVLAFDVFGTVVDWYSSVAEEVAASLPHVDADAFTRAWRAGYRPAMDRVLTGELGWTRIDDLHLMILRDLLARFGIDSIEEPAIRELNRAWHRLRPWPDSARGLERLGRDYMRCTLSNGNLGLLADLTRHGDLDFDCLLSAEVFRCYKPAPETYLGVADVFDVAPGDVLMVAAHRDDLDAARACGLQTAYIERPLEYGPNEPKDVSNRHTHTFHARDLLDLADQLGT